MRAQSAYVPVSVVMVARNEEEHVARSLEAAIREARTVGGDVVFVDSGSVDGTLKIAVSYPVRVAKMSEGAPLSAAAARRVGTASSTGEFIVFLDGDCEVAPGWIQAALKALEDDPVAGAVRGRLDEVYLDRGAIVGQKADPLGQTPDHPVATLSVGGNALYRRNALDAADGGFNPYIRSLEETDLCFRLVKKGYRVLSIPDKMATHYTENRWTFGAVFGRFARGLCVGYGQVLRSSVRHGFFLDFVRRENRTFLFLISCMVGIAACAVDILQGSVLWTLCWAALMGVPFAYMAVKDRSATWAALMYLTWFLNCVGVLQGLVRSLPDASSWRAECSVLNGQGVGSHSPDVLEPAVRSLSDV